MDPQPIPYATPTRKGTPPPGGVPTAAPVGWRTAAGAAWLAGVLAVGVYATATLCGQQLATATGGSLVPGTVVSAAVLVYALAGPAAFAVAVGAAAAVALYHWSASRLAWVAALPLMAGCWSVIGTAQYASPSTGEIASLLAVIFVQAGLIYAGTHLGRPLARWLTRHLVPPPLQASLLALWE